ncbi:hypothetical protein BC834DRAFT_570120 [Gloeopeniophorella convolvens]|nr:hypothetical protein BC834DRAFT_570120 [Gloeopeniophorella convolvens]
MITHSIKVRIPVRPLAAAFELGHRLHRGNRRRNAPRTASHRRRSSALRKRGIRGQSVGIGVPEAVLRRATRRPRRGSCIPSSQRCTSNVGECTPKPGSYIRMRRRCGTSRTAQSSDNAHMFPARPATTPATLSSCLGHDHNLSSIRAHEGSCSSGAGCQKVQGLYGVNTPAAHVQWALHPILHLLVRPLVSTYS